MPTSTTNFGLVKPGQQEFYDVDVTNANMDTIDGILKALQDAISSGASEQELDLLRQALATHMAEEASTTKKGHVQLSNAINGESITKAITEKALNTLRLQSLYYQRETVTDANSLVEPGYYMVGGEFIGSPYPGSNGSNQGYLSHFSWHGTSYLFQVHVSIHLAQGMRYRRKINGIWDTAWTGVIDESMKNVPNGYVGIGADGGLPSNIVQGQMKKVAEIDLAGQNTFSFFDLNNHEEFKILLKSINFGSIGNSTNMRMIANDNNFTLGKFHGSKLTAGAVQIMSSGGGSDSGAQLGLVTSVASPGQSIVEGELHFKKVSPVSWEVDGFTMNFVTTTTSSDLANYTKCLAGFGNYKAQLNKITITNPLNLVQLSGKAELWVKS